MSIHLIPVEGKVLVRLNEVKETKSGKIILPDNHSETCRFATVEAIGDKVRLFEVGQRVFLGYHVGNVLERPELQQYGDTLRIVGEGEIWGYVVEDSDGDLGLRPAESGTEIPSRTAN